VVAALVHMPAPQSTTLHGIPHVPCNVPGHNHMQWLPVLQRSRRMRRVMTIWRSCVQHIRFDNFEIWEGRCTPAEEPFDTELAIVVPEWPTLRANLDKPTVLTTQLVFEKAFVGGGCGHVVVTNVGSKACDAYEVEINIRPSWGNLMLKDGLPSFSGLNLLTSDTAAGASTLPLSAACVVQTIDRAADSQHLSALWLLRCVA
jgi:hypothetical protein